MKFTIPGVILVLTRSIVLLFNEINLFVFLHIKKIVIYGTQIILEYEM